MMTFAPGQTIVRRYFRGDHVGWAQAVRVIADDTNGLRLWLPVGAGFAWRVDANGKPLRAASISEFGAGRLISHEWRDANVLMLLRPGMAHSVWWFFRERAFTGWYVNLESPACRGPDRIDSVDHHLDIIVSPERRWQWKDEDEFAACTDQPGFWTAAAAREIRAEGKRVIEEIEAGAFPFDGTWCEFQPDPTWPLPRLPFIL
jgi:hypothetical protein